jgi:ribosomal protein S18 acetylase RimI-like enzyme
MMNHLTYKYRDCDLELTVLEDNASAIRIYKKYGFIETNREYGYGIKSDSKNVMCVHMVRHKFSHIANP